MLVKVNMIWDKVPRLPSPLSFGLGTVRASSYDPSRVYFEFSGPECLNLSDLYRKIKVWLSNARCVSIQFTYEGALPPREELKALKLSRKRDGIWRRQQGDLRIAAIPVVTAGKWIFSIQNRDGKNGVPVEACDLSSLFSFQLRINEKGEVVTS